MFKKLAGRDTLFRYNTVTEWYDVCKADINYWGYETGHRELERLATDPTTKDIVLSLMNVSHSYYLRTLLTEFKLLMQHEESCVEWIEKLSTQVETEIEAKWAKFQSR
jgi:hypothetical protein